MILAQITDTHIKSGGRPAYRLVDTKAALKKAIDHINAFTPTIDAVIVSGDLTDEGGADECATFRELISSLAVPFFMVPGNHDNRENLRAAFADLSYLRAGGAFIHYAVEDFPLRLIALDSTVPGESHGYLCPERLSWLERTLDAAPERPTMLFMHHPPFSIGIAHMDVQNLMNGDALFALLGRHPQVRHIATGHAHRAAETTRAGVGVSIAPNGAHSVTLDLDRAPGDAPSFTMEPPALRLFHIDDDANITSHLSYLGSHDGPFPFYDGDGDLID
ncbi:phosphodiesterase [Varunaivibrio sulfuroxidans]|uniref:3',5'-cyclic AMP phosphodiesterase CpdA n=1 Tax=Varunaivibrio sulfuroxidans TaxID=1773489 RepID=A0A4R3J6H6_9PROT|nr:phosphodiesterase [Varunaivibrio sulfuroxidans]TCS60934.1 3',5'-cyclic AMP phosphodiesterase CpdA [Varunaivibrio sulfuroxidans]WES31658.1 phosphodiesterase [Varunaivibrio sulfuroxidans]